MSLARISGSVNWTNPRNLFIGGTAPNRLKAGYRFSSAVAGTLRSLRFHFRRFPASSCGGQGLEVAVLR